VAVSNPKAIVFLTALFPQFIVTDQALIPQFLGLVTTLMIFSFSFLMFYALLAHKAKNWLATPARVKWFSRISGSAFIGFGVLMAASSRK
jgi:homoserine/homoserine lactone efflux protein